MNVNWPMRVHVVLTCWNRKKLTMRVIAQLRTMATDAGCNVQFFVLDDASSDGTPEALAGHPDVHLIPGDGHYFWARGMATAERVALGCGRDQQADYLLWVNDDVDFDPDALRVLLATAAQNPGSIVVGPCRDPELGVTTYGGYERYGRHPLHLRRVEPIGQIRSVDTMNGNIVLVPIQIAANLGGIDGKFSHSWADIDYGLRARRAGHAIVVLPSHVGACPRNPDVERTLVEEVRSFLGAKGPGHAKSLARILRRNSPLLWPFYFSATYALWVLRLGRRHGPLKKMF